MLGIDVAQAFPFGESIIFDEHSKFRNRCSDKCRKILFWDVANAPAEIYASFEFDRSVLKPRIILTNLLLSRFGYMGEGFRTGWP